VQWSTAAKTVTRPSSSVHAAVASVPHITSEALVTIVSSCRRGPSTRRARGGASSPASRISRSVRRLPVRTPRSRSRAQTLRCPSPVKGEFAITDRMCSVSSASV